MRLKFPLALIAVTALLLGPGDNRVSAQPQITYEVIPGFDVAETPSEFDRIAFVRYRSGTPEGEGPAAFLILLPGFFGGAEDFSYVATRLVTRLPWLQVLAVDRRNNFLENRCVMEVAQTLGQVLTSAILAAAYYLGGIDVPGCPPHNDPNPRVWNGQHLEFALSQEEASSLGMAKWGLITAVEDVRRLVQSVRSQHPRAKVFLGGHSLGGMLAQIYAAWRFGSGADTAGWRTIDGLVLVDGGVKGFAWDPELLAQYFDGREKIRQGQIFWEEPPQAPILGPFAEIGAMAASFDPTRESFLWQSLPAPFQWLDAQTCPTNKALFAAATDDNAVNPDFQLHQGVPLVPVDLNSDGQPDRCIFPNHGRLLMHWLDFDQVVPPELSSTDGWARALWASRQTNGVEWYAARALNATIDLAGNLNAREQFIDPATGRLTTAATLEGLRVFERDRVRLPVYVFVAAECRDRFDWYRSVSPRLTDFTLEDHSSERCPQPSSVPYAHLDPLFAEDRPPLFENDFVKSVTRWLRSKR